MEQAFTDELIEHVMHGKCASIAHAIVAGGNARAILDESRSAKCGVRDNSTLLHVAVRGRHVSACKLLLSQGVQADTPDAAGLLPIHYAATDDSVKVVEALLDAAVAVESAKRTAQARLERRSTAGKARMRAAQSQQRFDPLSFRRYLIEDRLRFRGRPKDVACPLPSCVGAGANLVHIAAASGAAEVVASCLAAGCDPNARDAAGMTPVLAAAYAGQFAPIMILADAGADLGARDALGRTAMAAAAEGGHTSVCEVLASMRAAQLVRTKGIPLHI